MTRMLPLALLLVACGPEDDGHKGFTTGGNTTETEGSCDVVEETPLAVDEAVGNPMNFAPQDALNELTGVTNTTNVYTFPDGLTVNLETGFLYDGGDCYYRIREKSGVLSQAELLACFTAIELEGQMFFQTGDGLFDETFDSVLQAEERRKAHFLTLVDPDTLTGTWTPADSGLDAAELGDFMLEFDGLIDPLGSEGTITAVSSDGSRTPVATWAPPPTQG